MPCRRPVRFGTARPAPFDPARDGTVEVRTSELQQRVFMAWFDAQPAAVRAALREVPNPCEPPPAFLLAELARAGAALTPDGRLILPPLAA